MKRSQRNLASNSGQLMIVAALAIAILISSTTIYVYEISKETNSQYFSSIANSVLALKQTTRNTMIASLVNISRGGERAVLRGNLDMLSYALRRLKGPRIYYLTFVPLNNSNYDGGVWLSWNQSDVGTSSVYLDFTLEVNGIAENITLTYASNVTTSVTISGYYTELVGNEKLADLTCTVYNEGKPALAESMTFFYERLGSWIRVNSSDNLSIMDYGNGTYRISFVAQTPSSALQVSTHVHDLRGIFVQANTTCTKT